MYMGGDYMEIKPTYAIVIYDNHVEAKQANEVFKMHDEFDKHLKTEAIYVGQTLHGKHWKGTRPNKIIDATSVRPIDFAWWHRRVKPFLASDCKFDHGVRFDV